MMSSHPNVYVLMAVYNGERWLAQQVQSVLDQVGVSVWLYISVDLSTDGSFDYCRDLAARHEHVEVLPYGASFGSATTNFSRLISEVDVSKADFVAFCDQDDVWNPDKLLRSVNTLLERSCSAVSSDVVAFWSDGRQNRIVKSQPQRKFDYVLEAAGPGSTYVVDAKVWSVYRQWLHDRIDMELPPHDWVLYAFCRIYGYEWFIMPEPTLRYRQHDANVLGANLGFRGRLLRMASIRNGEFRQDVARLSKLFGSDFPIETSRYSLLKHWPHLRRKRVEAIVFSLLCLAFW